MREIKFRAWDALTVPPKMLNSMILKNPQFLPVTVAQSGPVGIIRIVNN